MDKWNYALMMWTEMLEPASRDPTSKFWQYNLKLSLKDCIFWTTGRILKLQKSKKLRILPAFEWNYLQSCTGKEKENRRQKVKKNSSKNWKKVIKTQMACRTRVSYFKASFAYIKLYCRHADKPDSKGQKVAKKIKNPKSYWKTKRLLKDHKKIIRESQPAD